VPTRHQSHQTVRTGYALIGSSFVTKSKPSATAWAIKIRSKGSLCNGGSADRAATWLARIGNTCAAVRSVARRHHVDRSPIVSKPFWVLMTTSQYEATLTT